MDENQFFLLGLIVVGFVGSLATFTPNTSWNDVTVFFRKDKKEYLAYSNKFHGKVWLFVGISALLLLGLSFVSKIKIPFLFILSFYILFLLVMEVVCQVIWRKKKYSNKS
jgi:uncharacterized membrane protein YesL